MFKFDFDLEDEELDETLAPQISSSTGKANDAARTEESHLETAPPFIELQLEDLLTQLPDVISYSPVQVPSLSTDASAPAPVFLAKRDLYDARFQLIAAGADEYAGEQAEGSDRDLQYVEAPSDLVPGVYEGGLKTWECSVDLAGCVRDMLGDVLQRADSLRSLELGCGTAMPSLMLLREVLSGPPRPERRIELHLQDYNELVFRLVTLPNLILAWYMSPASAPFTASYTPPPTDDAAPEPLPPSDASLAGDLTLSADLLRAFTTSLAAHGVALRLFAGAWEAFPAALTARRYDVLLTSETLYAPASLAPLADLLWRAGAAGAGGLEAAAGRLSLRDAADGEDGRAHGTEAGLRRVRADELPVCLVAAKLVYFGVGGGVAEFTRAVESGAPSGCARGRGRVHTVWKKEDGVKRVVMEVKW